MVYLECFHPLTAIDIFPLRYKKPEPEEGELGLRLPFSSGYKAISTSDCGEMPNSGMEGKYTPRREMSNAHFLSEDP